MRPCLDLIDSLRALGVEQDLALPAIAVIGDQSSGKSSVLEALSGVALPRGSGKRGRPALSCGGGRAAAQWCQRPASGKAPRRAAPPGSGWGLGLSPGRPTMSLVSRAHFHTMLAIAEPVSAEVPGPGCFPIVLFVSLRQHLFSDHVQSVSGEFLLKNFLNILGSD